MAIFDGCFRQAEAELQVERELHTALAELREVLPPSLERNVYVADQVGPSF